MKEEYKRRVCPPRCPTGSTCPRKTKANAKRRCIKNKTSKKKVTKKALPNEYANFYNISDNLGRWTSHSAYEKKINTLINSDKKYKLGDILFTADDKPFEFCIINEINGKLVIEYADRPVNLPFMILSKIVNNNIKYNKALSNLGYLSELFFGNDGPDDVIQSYKDKNIF
jgi:hypothetical protein